MNYHEFKPLIIKELLESDGCTATKDRLNASLQSRFNNIKGVKNKLIWAIKELVKDGEISEKDGSFCINHTYKLQPQPILDTKNFLGRRFEQECKKFLNHMGFSNIKITGKTGDQGVDGKAQLILAKSLNLNFLFQCKSGQTKAGSPAIREFRGSLATSSCSGIIFAQSGFTKDAIKESMKRGPQQLFLFDKNNIGLFYKEKYLPKNNEA